MCFGKQSQLISYHWKHTQKVNVTAKLGKSSSREWGSGPKNSTTHTSRVLISFLHCYRKINYTLSVQDTSSVFSEQPKHFYQLSQHFRNAFGFCFHILISLPREISQPCLKPFLPAAHLEEKKGGKELREMSFPGTSVWVNDFGQKSNGSNSSKRICRHLCVQRSKRTSANWSGW